MPYKKLRFFSLKDKNMYHYCKIYQADYLYKDDYIGDTERNVITYWGERKSNI